MYTSMNCKFWYQLTRVISKSNFVWNKKFYPNKSNLPPSFEQNPNSVQTAVDEQKSPISETNEENNYAKMKNLLFKEFYLMKSCEIYNGFPGFYDLGPLGHQIKANILDLWREFFVLEEQMVEIETSTITPEPVLKASGHVDRFTDFIVKDEKTNESFRFDHLLKAQLLNLLKNDNMDKNLRNAVQEVLMKLDTMSIEEMKDVAKWFSIKSPNGNKLIGPDSFNLMFDVTVGPSAKAKGYLRPELAQGIFVNFKQLLEFHHGRLPFTVAQIGNAFRNELNPRSGLIRLREFTLAEFEHFLDPKDKNYTKFVDVENVEISLLTVASQISGLGIEKMTIVDALNKQIFQNQTIGYFIARIQLFLQLLGIDENRLRFRQHSSKELAHYALDCWDAECETSQGWIECIGCADRSSYDLSRHSDSSEVCLSAQRIYPEPITREVTELIPDREKLKKHFKNKANRISKILSSLDEITTLKLEKELMTTGKFKLNYMDKEWILTKDMIQVNTLKKNMMAEAFIPHVFEASFGIGRIMHSLLEHTFSIRENEKRKFFSLPAHIAPIKCAIFPLNAIADFETLIQQIAHDLKDIGVRYQIFDGRGSIGRRYVNSDHRSIPFGITVDYDSLKKPHTVTLRDRETMQQIRISLEVLPKLIEDLVCRKVSWEDIKKIYPVFKSQQGSENPENVILNV